MDARRTVAGSVHARVVSRALEVRVDPSCLSTAQFPPIQYAYDDFTISQVAKMLGNHTDAEKVRIPLVEAFSRRVIIRGVVCHESWILCQQLEFQRDHA